jgi:thiamine-phosphate diphosphorylase
LAVRAVVCMVTDRQRIQGGSAEALVRHVGAAARAGVHLVQVRERDLEARALTDLVARCVDAVAPTRTRILVNDRLDVALAAGAHGVHLRGDSVAAARVRALAPRSFLIGRSVHAVAEAVRASEGGGLDYLLFGTVFETGSKPGLTAVGPAALAHVAAATRLPVLAIGGLTIETLPGIGETGAAGFAAIGLFAGAPLDQLQVVVHQASSAFDTPATVP